MSVSVEYERPAGGKGCIAHLFINGRKWYTGTGSNEKEALESLVQSMAQFITETIQRAANTRKR